MIQKRSCSLSTKVNRNFHGMIKIRLIMVNNVNIFTIYNVNLYSKASGKFYRQFTKTKLTGKMSKLPGHKLFEHYFLKNWLKFYDKMNLSIRMRIIYNVNHRYKIRLKFGDKFLTSLTKFVLKTKASMLYNQGESILYCHKFLSFVVVVII